MCRYKAKKKAFSKYEKAFDKSTIEEKLAAIKKNCSVVRVLAHTQIRKIGFGQKKAHIFEIQVRFSGRGSSLSEMILRPVASRRHAASACTSSQSLGYGQG